MCKKKKFYILKNYLPYVSLKFARNITNKGRILETKSQV